MALKAAALSFLAGGSAAMIAVPTGGETVNIEGAVDQARRCCGEADPHLCPGHVPDIPARVFSDGGGTIRMIVGSTSYFPMAGPSVFNQTRSCTVSFNKTADPNPAHYAANEYIDSPVAFPNGTVVALVHTEFPGNQYNDCPDGAKGYPKCWSVSVGMVVSHDGGRTFSHVRTPPGHLVASVPYRYNPDQLASGWGDPSNILRHPTDGYYYVALWNRHDVGSQPRGICVARTRDLLDPRAWRAWNGTGYSIQFADPYAIPSRVARDHVCTVTNLPAGDVVDGCAAHGLVWSTYLEKFVVTLGCNQARTPVFKYAVSDDLIHWSNAQTLFTLDEARKISAFVRIGMNYPTFIDPRSPVSYGDSNFGTIGRSPYLFWVSEGDNPEDIGRHLLATPFMFTK